MRNDKASREIRQLLAAALYREPWPLEWLREGSKAWPFHKVVKAWAWSPLSMRVIPIGACPIRFCRLCPGIAMTRFMSAAAIGTVGVMPHESAPSIRTTADLLWTQLQERAHRDHDGHWL
jgi:hypothetical protein